MRISNRHRFFYIIGIAAYVFWPILKLHANHSTQRVFVFWVCLNVVMVTLRALAYVRMRNRQRQTAYWRRLIERQDREPTITRIQFYDANGEPTQDNTAEGAYTYRTYRYTPYHHEEQ